MKTVRSIAVILLLLQTAVFADPLAELSGFSAFKSADLSKMAGGGVTTVRTPPLDYTRGLSVQFCYVVPLPLQKTIELHERWNATRHPDFKVYLHFDLSPKPSPEDFSKIASAPDNAAVQALAAATQKLDPNQPQLLMSSAEAKLFKPAAAPTHAGAMPVAVTNFWSDLLLRRAIAFSAGGLSKQPPYNFHGETVQLTAEVDRLLKEEPKIHGQFASLTDSLTGGGSPPVRQLYWELSNVEGVATFSLGALCAKAPGASWQAIDLHYYASDGYFVMLTFYQMWPVMIGAQQATLVWRCDLLSAPTLNDLHGVERLASTNAMTKEIQKSIAIFLKDAAAK